jgi:ubiquinone/menaquinone biosynthesis C-methylase UbiE
VLDRDIAAFYELGLEDSRLFIDGRPRLEYLRTLELLERLLPAPPSRVLDVGGGTGVYAMSLTGQGHEVRVVEPSQAHVDHVRAYARDRDLHRLTAVVGDARTLPADDDSYDAVLLLGPLYHLTERDDRLRALGEAVRVTRPGGVVVAVGISRFASLIDGLKRQSLGDQIFRAIVEADLADGQHRNPDVEAHPEFFTTAYFHLPSELREEADTAGLSHTQLLAVEGPSWIVENIDDLDNQLFAARAVESEPSLMAATSHIMVAGIAPERPLTPLTGPTC